MGDLSNEPSMEDILSSIKKIIADDAMQTLSPRVRSAPKAESKAEKSEKDAAEVQPVAVDDDDVLELTNTSDPIAPSVDDGIVSQESLSSSRSAFDSLAQVKTTSKPKAESSNALEEMIRDMLRPMLKDWLDAHLPDIVRNEVKREVARIAGRSD